MKPQLTSIMDYIDACIWNDFMVGILITSAAEGRLPSLGFDYGVGKSTLMLQIAHLFIAEYGKCRSIKEEWDRVFSMLHAFPWELEHFFYTAPKRYFGEPIFFLYDDIQRTLGKDRSRDPYVKSLKNRLTTSRPQLAVFMATAPDIDELARPFRLFFNFEIKVPRRGVYEVQRLKKWTDFRRPYETQVSMPKKDWRVGLKFEKLPSEIELRYSKWREEANRRYDEGEGEWRLRSIRNVLSDEAKELVKILVKRGGYTRQQIITQMERGIELRLLKNCGLVEIFGDVVVPTRQAQKLINLL